MGDLEPAGEEITDRRMVEFCAKSSPLKPSQAVFLIETTSSWDRCAVPDLQRAVSGVVEQDEVRQVEEVSVEADSAPLRRLHRSPRQRRLLFACLGLDEQQSLPIKRGAAARRKCQEVVAGLGLDDAAPSGARVRQSVPAEEVGLLEGAEAGFQLLFKEFAAVDGHLSTPGL